MSKTRMGKRVASLLLSLVMMLSLLPTTVYAEGADTGDTTDEIVGQATTSGDNTEGTGEPEPTGEGEDGSANVTEGEDGAATNDAVVEETIAPVNAEGVDAVANAESSGDEAYVAQVGEKQYTTLQAAFDAANTDDTVTLLRDITLTEQVNITKALNGLTLDGNNKTITCATTTDPLQSGGSALYFGNASDKLYCTGIKIRDLTMTGTARFAIFLCGGTTTEFTNVNISGNYYIAVNLYGTHGATMTNCNISNSTTGTDEYISGVWSNVASQNPLELVNSKVDVIAINTYTTANTLAPKIFIDKDSSAEIHTFDDGSVSGNKKLCVSTESEGTYTIKEYVETTSTWVEVKDYVAEVNGTQYETLQEAIKAASTGNTITLLDDVDLGSSKIGFYKTGCENLTFDLNGHKITSAIQNNGTVVASRVGLVIKNGTIENTCMDTNAKKATSAVYVTSGGTTTLENVTLHSNYSGLYVCQLLNAVTVVVNVEKDTVINGGMYGVNLDAPKGTATTAPGVTLNVNGGTITGTEYGIHANSPSSGKYGTINANITAGTVGGVCVVSNNANQPVKLDITGGTINGKLYNPISTNGASSTVTISGGTFENPVDPSYCAEGYTPVKNADGTYGVVEAATAVAQIGETTYATLEAAFAAANNGATITLLVDLDLSATGLTIAANKDVTLDLNGKTLKLANTNSGNIKVFGKLTLQDITDTAKNGTGTGKVWTETSYILGKQDKVLIAAIDGGTFIMESGLIDAASFTTDNDNDGQFAVSVQNENADATVIINGGCIKAGWYAIAGNGQNIEYNGNITVNGGILESTADYAIYHPHSGTTTINGGVVFGAAGGVSLNRGKLIVNNGIITSKGTGTTGDWGDGTGNQNAAAINVYAGYGSTSVEIKGGKITAEKDAILLTNGKDGTIKVSGGTFNSAVKEEYCADGYIPAKNADGTYGVKEGQYVAQVGNVKYETLQAAIDAAARKATVTMLADTKENVTISTPYLTLELNGFTLNGSTGERKPALTITARVTVKDSSVDQTGTIMREDTAGNSGVSSHYVIDVQGDGWLTFESGIVKNNSGTTDGKGASLVRVGDDSVDKYPGLNIKGGTFTQNNFIVIKVDSGDLFLNGGTLNSTDSYAIEDWHRATIKGGTVNGAVAAWTYSRGHNSDLSISGGTVNGNVESVSYDGAAGKKASVSITGGVVNGMLSTHIYNKETEPSKDIATIAVTGGTFSSDPTKYVVEDSAITPNADGTYGVAKAYLARIGETFYYTMEDAFQAQTNGDTIVLLRDYTTGGTFNSGSINRTVDLNDHTWTCTGTDANSAAFEINYPNASLTVKNGKIVSSQLVGLIPSASGGTITYDNSSLTFENVKMSTTATSGIETNGNNTSDAVTLKDSTLNVPNGFGIYFPSSGTLTIDNSTITAKTMGVQVCAGSLSISGDQTAITVSGDAVPKTENDGAIQDGAAISIVNRPGYKRLGDVTVTGGTFKANGTNVAIKAYDWDNTNNVEKTFTANDKVFVSGGTFSSIPDNMDGLCKDGFVPVKNADGYAVQTGTYVASIGTKKFATLAEAVEAAKDGDAVKLLGDVVLAETLIIKDKTITLDLNGRTISNSADIWNESKYAWSLISVRDNGDLTINDTTGGGTLKAKENDCFALDVYAYDTKNVEDTKLTINAGNYVGNISAVYAFTGKATINGGHFSIQQKKDDGDPYRFTLNCYDANRANGTAKIIVNGGTFTNFDPRNNKAEGAGTSFVAEGVGVNYENGTFTATPNMAAQIVDAGGGSVAAYAGHYDAIAAAKDGETVILLSDRKNFVTNTINANITIDLNGKTLSDGNNNPFFRTNGEVTIQNGTITSNYPCVIVNAYNKLTLKNVKITGVTGDNGKNLVNVCSNAEVTIDKDTVLTASGSGVAVFIGQDADAKYTLNVYGKVIQQKKSYAISGNGSYEGATTINIYEGAEVRSASVAIYHPQAGEINVYGGLVEGYCGIGIKSGTLNITGGQVLGVGDDDELSDENSNPNGMTYDGSAIVIDSHTGYKGNVKINISGSAFIQSRCSTGIREIGNDAGKTNVKGLSISGGTVLSGGGKDAVQVREVTKNNVFITGGSFSTDVAAYCATGYQCNVPTADEPLYTVTKKDADEIDVKRSLTLDNSLTMNYKVKLPTGYTSARVEFKFYNDYTKAFETVTVTGVFNNSTGRYESAFTGINPQRMTDTLKATVYATNEDTQEETAFPVDDFSAAQYCNVLLASGYNKNGAYNELVGNLVAYGTAAQLYQKYHTDKLVSSVVTGGTVVQHPLADVAEVNELTAVTGGVSIEKKSLVLSNAFAIRVKFALEGDTTIDQVTFKVKADAKTATISQFEKETLSDGTVYYYFDFAGLNSKQLGSTVTFTAVVDGKDNDVLAFSANTYLKLMSNVAGVSTELKNLLAALYNYGYTCRNFKA